MSTPEFDELKAKYRLQEENGSFYIQEKSIFGWSYTTSNIFLFSIFGSIFCLYFIGAKTKDFAFECDDIKSAQRTIDSLVTAELKERATKLQKKEAKAKKKYHYFFTVKQQRKEKLKKINGK